MISVACIGDSLTFGYLVENRIKNCYPTKLNQLLGNGYEVKNFGVNSLTMLKSNPNSYWNHENFKLSLDYNPEIVIIMLGTNDAKSYSWQIRANYRQDYEEMISLYQNLHSKPQIFLVTPPTAFLVNNEPKIAFGIDNDCIQEMVTIIKSIGQEQGLPVIDLNQKTVNHPEYFPLDGIHTNAEGAAFIAKVIYQEIMNCNLELNNN